MGEESERIFQNMVRIGTVSAVDGGARRARVIFPDKEMTSGWLHVLQNASWMPGINDNVLVLYLPVFNGDGFILGAI